MKNRRAAREEAADDGGHFGFLRNFLSTETRYAEARRKARRVPRPDSARMRYNASTEPIALGQDEILRSASQFPGSDRHQMTNLWELDAGRPPFMRGGPTIPASASSAPVSVVLHQQSRPVKPDNYAIGASSSGEEPTTDVEFLESRTESNDHAAQGLEIESASSAEQRGEENDEQELEEEGREGRATDEPLDHAGTTPAAAGQRRMIVEGLEDVSDDRDGFKIANQDTANTSANGSGSEQLNREEVGRSTSSRSESEGNSSSAQRSANRRVERGKLNVDVPRSVSNFWTEPHISPRSMQHSLRRRERGVGLIGGHRNLDGVLQPATVSTISSGSPKSYSADETTQNRALLHYLQTMEDSKRHSFLTEFAQRAQLSSPVDEEDATAGQAGLLVAEDGTSKNIRATGRTASGTSSSSTKPTRNNTSKAAVDSFTTVAPQQEALPAGVSSTFEHNQVRTLGSNKMRSTSAEDDSKDEFGSVGSPAELLIGEPDPIGGRIVRVLTGARGKKHYRTQWLTQYHCFLFAVFISLLSAVLFVVTLYLSSKGSGR
ncbi:unnamed protein product [Amoebophrya sp. A25]|nr:unnamed protein product [Amoebophrya sp. A25]|eukprot:GSA25T00000094001.1